MSRNKILSVKRRLGKAGRRTRRAPIWVVVKTRGRIRDSVKRRRWYRSKLKP
ncbi:MAG: 50S ribosomal protein L39e [Hadesarchaea archaeon]|nr:50S ribosomal protein L39e [Hadesarchaea archaeon]TDA32948.1 MAG: 50S ribosomal protein L39e [Hadesarchaea archaeon]